MIQGLRRRLAALLAIAAVVAMLALALALVIDHVAQLVAVWAALVVASIGAWFMVTRRGAARLAGAVVAAVALVVAVVVLLGDGALLAVIGVVVLGAIAIAAGRYAVAVDPAMLREQEPPGVRMPRPNVHPPMRAEARP